MGRRMDGWVGGWTDGRKDGWGENCSEKLEMYEPRRPVNMQTEVSLELLTDRPGVEEEGLGWEWRLEAIGMETEAEARGVDRGRRGKGEVAYPRSHVARVALDPRAV